MPYTSTDQAGQGRVVAFTNALENLGWVAGRNVRFEVRWCAEAAEITGVAEELVSTIPDAILCTGTPAALALKKAT